MTKEMNLGVFHFHVAIFQQRYGKCLAQRSLLTSNLNQTIARVSSGDFFYFFKKCTEAITSWLTSVKLYINCTSVKLKLRKEMGNVSKRQQPDHRAENSRRPPIGSSM